MFERVTILGAGLLGASLGQVVKTRKLATEVFVWARREEIRNQLDAEADWCDLTFASAHEAVQGSDLVVACTPVEHIVALLDEIKEYVRKDALITDVGSVKAQICRKGKSLFTKKGTFIGSHPMAGSEKSGMAHADPKLYEGRNCFVTPSDDAVDRTLVTKLTSFWENIGMQVTLTNPAEHDKIVAHISHLPHFLASALAYHLSGKPYSWDNLCGGGLRDTTRIAAGDPTMWTDIARQNCQQIITALDEFEDSLRILRQHLETNDQKVLKDYLKTGQTYRNRLPNTYDSD